MEKKLKIILLQGWEDISHENPEGPNTFCRTASENPSSLQISIQATYSGGKKPDPTIKDLIEFAQNMITNNEGKVARTNSGECKLGLFGAAQGKLSDADFIRVWVLSNGFDFILATQISIEGMPDSQDLDEGHSTVMNIDYV